MGAECDRRDFLKLGARVGAGLALGGVGVSGCRGLAKTEPAAIKAAPIDVVRVGFVGIGARGSRLFRILLELEGVEVGAVCDIREDRVGRAQRWVQEAGQAKPVGYCCGKMDFERMCEREALDLVVTATPWKWHTPVCVAAMKAGKHAATEVPAAATIEECWHLVETAEKYNRHCVMLENCCYFPNVMMVLNMVRQGLFGELLHGETGQYDDSRYWQTFGSKGNLGWFGKHLATRNGNLYPTHAIGPVAQWMNINRGDRFDYLVSMSSNSRGMNVFAAEKLGPEHPLASRKFAQGDINTTLIHTVNGLTVTLYFDLTLPQPNELVYRLQGSRGIFSSAGSPWGGYKSSKIHIEGRSPRKSWEPLENYIEEFQHPLWKTWSDDFDYMELFQLIKALRSGTATDMDVYDAATWSAISELSERSVAKESRPIRFPDFTGGRWKTNPPISIVGA